MSSRARGYCADCGTRCRGKRCQECHAATRPAVRRPEHPCVWCGQVTTSHARVCDYCKGIDKIPSPTEDDALTGGRWVRRGSRQVYLTIEDEIAEYARRHQPRTRRPHAPGLDCCCCTGDLSRGLARRTLDGWAHAQGCAA